MRITTSMQYARFLETLRSVKERIAGDQSRMASGKRLEKPSDDPVGAAEALELRAQVARLDRYGQNASAARAFLGVGDSALSSVTELLAKARSAATQGASDTTAQGRAQIASDIDGIRDQLLALARTRYRDRYVFSGTDTSTNPYTDAAAYQGNGAEIRVDTGDAETTSLNVTGPTIFGAGTGVFGVLDQLAADLRAGNTAAIQSAIPTLEAASRTVSDARAILGGRMARIDAGIDRHADARVAILTRVAGIEDTDLAEEITRLANDSATQQATLAAGARINSRSLFDYLT